MVDPMTPPPGLVPKVRTMTLILDGGAPFEQQWFSSDAGYGISDQKAGFSDVIEKLKTHRQVEFVLSEAGTEIDRHAFTLNGAAQAIDKVISACAKT
jgi:hypothetical protein